MTMPNQPDPNQPDDDDQDDEQGAPPAAPQPQPGPKG